MPIMRSPVMASATIARYRGSKMCSGRNTLGKRTTFGSGNSGRRSDMVLVDRFRFLIHVIHEHVLTEGVGCGELRLALADLGDAPDKTDEVVIARQHERVDHDATFPAGGDLGAGLGHDEGIEAESVLVDAAVGLRQG